MVAVVAGALIVLTFGAIGSFAAHQVAQRSADIPSIQQPPVLTGDTTNAGNPLTVTDGVWTNSPTSFTYDWYRCAGTDCSTPTLVWAAGNTYTPDSLDLGGVIFVVVTATNGTGSSHGANSNRVGPIGAPTAITPPEISGDTSTVGDVLSVSDGTWEGSLAFTYRWRRCDPFAELNCTDIPGATSNEYTIVDGDLGYVLQATVTATGTSASADSPAWTSRAIGVPSIVGFAFPDISGDTSAVGNVLTVSTGTWTGSPTFTYQWQRCDTGGGNCADIPGATSNDHTIMDDDFGHFLVAKVTATGPGGAGVSLGETSEPVGVPRIVGSDVPGISGDTSAVGNVLTVSTGTWTGSPTFTYQWQRCDADGSNCADISGATAGTYTLQSDDVGHLLDANVTATNVAGDRTSRIYTLLPVGLPRIVGFDDPRISGDTSVVGNLLTVSTGTWTGSPTFTYQWQRCDAADTNCADIAGATTSAYTLQSVDLGRFIQVTVTATASGGTASQNAWTSTLVGVPEIAGFAFPIISGDTSSAGNLLSVSTGTWTGSPTFTYQWRRCDADRTNCADIAGATASTYAIQAADLGHLVYARVTATNSFGSASQTATTITPAGAPTIVGLDLPEINGDESAVGNVLTVSTGTWTGSPTFTYQWQRCDADGTNCADVSGATAGTYTLQADDVSHTVEVIVTATNAYGSKSNTAISFTVVGVPQIVGFDIPLLSGDTSSVGNVLTVSSGSWSGAPAITYQWQRCDANGSSCVDIDGATSSTYTLQTADLGHIIQATVTATNAAGHTTEQALTTSPIGAPTILGFDFPAISGDTSGSGNVLTVSTGTWGGSPTLTYQWSRCDAIGFICGDIDGATSRTYTIQAADLGHALRATVTATNANGATTESATTSGAVGVPAIANFAFPAITGDETGAGNVLSVSTGTWTASPTSFAYQWNRCDANGLNCDPIDGATSSTYTTQADDLDHVLQATVTATNANGQQSAFAWSRYAIGLPEEIGSAPQIVGSADAAGNVLAVSHGGWSGSPTFTYQWEQCDSNDANCAPIDGATSNRYTIQIADVGHYLEALVTATNSVGSATDVANTNYAVGTPQVVGAFPAIHGNPTAVGNRITVTTGTWSGAPTFSYEWDRCDAFFVICTPIAGQTSNGYTITTADMGHGLEAKVTATNANGSSSSDASVLVGAPFNVTVPTISGDVSAVGNTLTVSNGTWDGNPTSFTRQWWRCDAASNCSEIGGATGTTYTITSADAGDVLFVLVIASNAVGLSESETADTAAVGTGASQHLLSVTVGGSGTGLVTSNPDGIDCGDTCSSAYNTSTTVVLTPHPSAGSTFAGWSGGGCSGTGGCSVHLSSDLSVTATFTTTPGGPTITGFTPASGSAHATVTVTGTNLIYTRSVKLDGESVPFTVVSATTITFTVPGDATSGTIVITTTSGTATSSGTFTVASSPTITSISPGSGVVGTVVTITGTNLAGVVGVEIGHILVVPSSVSSTQVTFVIPPGAATGTIEVLSPAGSATSSGTFTVTG